MENQLHKIRIGMGQLLVEGGEPTRNMERATEMITDAAKIKCDIILLPEVLDLGWTDVSAKNEAEPIPGARSDILCQQAKKNRIYVCAGLTEKLNGKIYNTAILIDREGKLLLKYQKINVLLYEQEFYEIGQTLNVIDTEFGKIGINICADNYRDALHIGHTLARMGAQLILSPSSWTVSHEVSEDKDPYTTKWIEPYSILASLYNLIIIGATSVGYLISGPYVGEKSVGCSLAMGPRGIIKQGQFNEFAGELVPVDIVVPERKEKGTEIGKMLKYKGYIFDKYES